MRAKMKVEKVKEVEDVKVAKIPEVPETPEVVVAPVVTEVISAPEVVIPPEIVESEVSVLSRVPQVDMSAPLPSLDEPKVDEVMIVARREWYVGIGLFVIFLAVVGAVGWGYIKVINQQPSDNQALVSVTPAPTASPEVVVIKPKYAVWNGSGVAGAAGLLADKLKLAGYEVIETKNAPEPVVGNQVEAKANMSVQRTSIESELDKVGASVASWSALLPDSTNYDVRVVIGK